LIVDTHVNEIRAPSRSPRSRCWPPRKCQRFGLMPRAALLSHSNFGTSNSESARKMRTALALLREQAPELEVDGEMHGDTALNLRCSSAPCRTAPGR
jgi:malate dehydrogenase (oxaloacetate-decarboxylating)(NADP+)